MEEDCGMAREFAIMFSPPFVHILSHSQRLQDKFSIVRRQNLLYFPCVLSRNWPLLLKNLFSMYSHTFLIVTSNGSCLLCSFPDGASSSPSAKLPQSSSLKGHHKIIEHFGLCRHQILPRCRYYRFLHVHSHSHSPWDTLHYPLEGGLVWQRARQRPHDCCLIGSEDAHQCAGALQLLFTRRLFRFHFVPPSPFSAISLLLTQKNQ